MAPCVVIPTFWTRRRMRIRDELLNVYDHPTPIDADGPLPHCLRSLGQVEGLGKVIIVVAATSPAIEHQAEERVRSILAGFPEIDALVFGPAELGSLHRRLEQLEYADMIAGTSLVGYGAVRNVGLLAAAILGCDEVVFVDDDQVVIDPGFLQRAVEGLGQDVGHGHRMLAKSGYYTDEAGSYQHHRTPHWSDMFWRQDDAFNDALSIVDAPPRLQKSPVAFGGCLALHRDMYCNVSFDPWVVRGEDIDYVINARMHGGDVYLDGEWSIVHRPPKELSEALRFRQDVYRFVYEHRKLEFAKSQVDLRQVTPEALAPYPGAFVGSSVTWRAVLTSLLRGISKPERGRYFRIAREAVRDAAAYARENCQNYYRFQRRWPLLVDSLWEDIALRTLFTGERKVDRTAITGRFPIVRED